MRVIIGSDLDMGHWVEHYYEVVANFSLRITFTLHNERRKTMEKTVAVKEWCIERAMDMLYITKPKELSADTIIKEAKQIERYING